MSELPSKVNDKFEIIPRHMPEISKNERALEWWELGQLHNELMQHYQPTMDEWGSDDEEYTANRPVGHVNFTKSPKLHRRPGIYDY